METASTPKWKRYELQARMLNALGHPIRLAIADLLRQGETCVCDIARHIGAERSNTSRHLSIMLRAGMLRMRKDGLQAMYSLQVPCVCDFLSCATRVVEHDIQERIRVLESIQST
ncbi:MAG: winged helix-turn-helix transcriptional regulator [Phycisphaeraceae bacterium]|nr:winged helix-turn-helix transcriptional regulator [Phycisphaeraceae bacterium]